MKIALLQLYSNGDCLFATVIAAQLRHDYPEATITWYVAKHCKGMLINNSDINEIVDIDIAGKDGKKVWDETHAMLMQKKERGEIDLLISSQLIRDNERYYTGTIRSSLFRTLGKPITVGYQPRIHLTTAEIEKVAAFVDHNKIREYKNVVAFECAPISGQAALTPALATQMSETILKQMPDTCFVLTSNQKIETTNPHIKDASSLSIRENAELLNYCTHLVGCSSGISWLSTSSWCKQLPSFQIMNNKAFYFNSMVRDCKYLGIPANHITEVGQTNSEKLTEMIALFVKNKDEAHAQFHQELSDKSTTVYSLARTFILQHKFVYALSVLKGAFQLNRLNPMYYYHWIKLVFFFPFLLLLSLTGKQNN